MTMITATMTDISEANEALRKEVTSLRDRIELLRNEVTSLRGSRNNFVDAINEVIKQDEATPDSTITYSDLNELITTNLGKGEALKFKRTYQMFINYTVQAQFSVEAYSEEDAELEFESSGTTFNTDFYVPSDDIIFDGWTEEGYEVASVEEQ